MDEITQVIKNRDDKLQSSSVTYATDEAEGLHWYVAVVHHNAEIKVADQLKNQGFEVYVASQPRLRIYSSGRKKWVNQLVISSKIFIRCTEQDRLNIVKHPFIFRFLTNRSGDIINGHKPLAIIPDKEIEILRFMLGQSEYPVDFQEPAVVQGDIVKVIRGSLKGLEGKVIESSLTHKTLIIQLEQLGSARLSLPLSDIHPLP